MTRDFWSDARRFLRGKTYVNFSGVLEEGEDAVGQSYGENHERLARIKARYDPDNVSGLTRTSARALSGVAAGGKPTVIGRSAALDGDFSAGIVLLATQTIRKATMRFDPDKHRAHQTFESACLERYRSRSGDKRRAWNRPVPAGARW